MEEDVSRIVAKLAHGVFPKHRVSERETAQGREPDEIDDILEGPHLICRDVEFLKVGIDVEDVADGTD